MRWHEEHREAVIGTIPQELDGLQAARRVRASGSNQNRIHGLMREDW